MTAFTGRSSSTSGARSTAASTSQIIRPRTTSDSGKTCSGLCGISGIPIIRYPGDFVSGYNWEDGVGPVDQRPARLDLAWRTTEPNKVGTNEFATWSRASRRTMMASISALVASMPPATLSNTAISSGTTGATFGLATAWPSRTNSRSGVSATRWTDPGRLDKKRQRNGRIAHEAAKVMKLVDSEIELVACGSSIPGCRTFRSGKLRCSNTYDDVEYLAPHLPSEEGRSWHLPRAAPRDGPVHQNGRGHVRFRQSEKRSRNRSTFLSTSGMSGTTLLTRIKRSTATRPGLSLRRFSKTSTRWRTRLLSEGC